MWRNRRAVATIALGLAVLSPSVALGQEPGVRLDRGPSSKEYAIPLDAARAATQTGAVSRTQGTPTAGAAQPDAGASTSSATGLADAKTRRSQDATAGTAPNGAPAQPPPTATRVSSAGTNDGFVIAGLALAAIALGGLAGLLLRRRRATGDEF